MTTPRKRAADRRLAPSRFASLSEADSLRVFVRNLREGIYITDAAGMILDANPAFLQLLGIAAIEDLASRNFNDLVVDIPRWNREMATLSLGGVLRETEVQITRPDGSLRTVLATAYGCADPVTGDLFFHGILVDISARKEQENVLYEQSIRDPLTGCYNRRYLDEIEHRFAAVDARWACVFVDIDHFKQYNDQHGHQMGDSTLIRMGRFLMRQVRAEEPVVRMGGDEFLVVLDGASERQAELVVRRLQLAALSTAPASFSLGWAARSPGESFAQTRQRADQQLLAVRVVERDPERGRTRTPPPV